MNSWLRALDLMLPAAVVVLAQITALLIAGLALQRIVRRSAAARHAVLVWTLVAVGLSPVLMIALQLAAIPAPFALSKSVVPINVLFGNPGAAPTFRPAAANDLSLAGILIAVWAVGALFSLMGLVRGLRLAQKMRRGATPISAQRIAGARAGLATVFKDKPPQIFASDQVEVPVALGYLRPIVLLPSSLMAKIDDQQLLQVLVHECAHALRRDALVALYQRILVAIFWFHPLVRFTSWLLDGAREELCDNYVLQSAPARDYAQTLLTVAESLSQQPNRWFAPALIQSASLESRIASLLNSRRCIMTNLSSKKIAAIAACLVGSAITLSCFAGAPAAQQNSSSDFSHVVNLGKTSTGDSITVQEVRGSSDTLAVGNTYEVKGTYKLVSHDKALLAVYVTVEASQPHTSHPALPDQKMIVEKDEGSFTLRFHMWHEGKPHVSFYPAKGGNGFAATYF